MTNLEIRGAMAKEHVVLSVTAIIGLSNSLHYGSFVLRLIRKLVRAIE